MKYCNSKKCRTSLDRVLDRKVIRLLGPICKTTEANSIVVNGKLVQICSDLVIVKSEEGKECIVSLITPNYKTLLQSLLSDTREHFINLLIENGSETFKGLYQILLEETKQILLRSNISVYKSGASFVLNHKFSLRFVIYSSTIIILDNNYLTIVKEFSITSNNKKVVAKQINDFIINEIQKYKNN